VGYGDLYPISSTGRIISIISSMIGIAVIALPSGIITAGYMEELRRRRKLDEIKMQKQELSISDRLRS
jgi:voltage-gated potassium channel